MYIQGLISRISMEIGQGSSDWYYIEGNVNQIFVEFFPIK